jgi:hypothetical protein
VQAVYKRLGESAEWARYIAHLRVRERRLRNLMKELDGAGL